MKRSPNFPRAALAVVALLGACGASAPADGDGADGDARAWTIGPIVRGRNYSEGVPLHPSPSRGGGWHIDLPQAPGSLHYVTFRHGSLAGKRRIVMRYRIDADRGVRIHPYKGGPAFASVITLYFQRGGDNWSGRGRFETYRWYATFASKMPIVPGEHVMVAPLNGRWTAVGASTAGTNPAAFQAAVAGADQVGFVLGGGDGYGHGVYATGRARLTVTDFRIE
jgi:hypothetical protein